MPPSTDPTLPRAVGVTMDKATAAWPAIRADRMVRRRAQRSAANRGRIRLEGHSSWFLLVVKGWTRVDVTRACRAVFLFEVEQHQSSASITTSMRDADRRNAHDSCWRAGFSAANARRGAGAGVRPRRCRRGGGGKANQFVCLDGPGVIPDSGYIRKEKMTSRVKIRVRSGKTRPSAATTFESPSQSWSSASAR
jgi:hypothetical protein